MRFLIFLACYYLLLVNPSYGQDREDICGTVDAKAVITPGDAGSVNVKIEAKKLKEPTNYIFFDESGRLLGEDVKSKERLGLKGGTYYCVIKDSRGCTKRIKFNTGKNLEGDE